MLENSFERLGTGTILGDFLCIFRRNRRIELCIFRKMELFKSIAFQGNRKSAVFGPLLHVN